jgi:hypothetical protein
MRENAVFHIAPFAHFDSQHKIVVADLQLKYSSLEDNSLIIASDTFALFSELYYPSRRRRVTKFWVARADGGELNAFTIYTFAPAAACKFFSLSLSSHTDYACQPLSICLVLIVSLCLGLFAVSHSPLALSGSTCFVSREPKRSEVFAMIHLVSFFRAQKLLLGPVQRKD